MKKILLVEDDPAIQEMFSMVFKEPEYTITCYMNGQLLLKNNYPLPDIFILDKQLSGNDGLDICRHLKSHSQTCLIPVVMISANPLILELAREAGADNVLLKPFRLADLREMVSTFVYGIY